MKNYIWICIGLVLIIISACQRQIPVSEFVPEQEDSLCHTRVLSLEPSGVLDPLYMRVIDSVLLIVEDSGEPIVKILNDRGDCLGSFGKKGRGPGEFIQAVSVDLYSDKDTLWSGIYDASRKRYVKIPCGVDSTGRYVKEMWTSDKNFDMIGRLSEHCYVGSVVFDSSRFYLLDSSGRIRARTANFPPKPDGVPLLSHSMTCSGILSVAPRDSIFASCVAYDGGVDVCQVVNGAIQTVWRFSQFDMDYDILSEYHNVPTPNSRSRTGYVSLCFSNDYLYALYSGRKTLDEDSGLSDEVHVFSYDGIHRKRYYLDRRIGELGVDKDDNRLFGLATNPDGIAELIIYDLKAL